MVNGTIGDVPFEWEMVYESRVNITRMVIYIFGYLIHIVDVHI